MMGAERSLVTVFLSRMWANGFGLKRRELYGKLIFLIKNAEKGFTPSVSVSTTKQMYFFNLLKMTCSFFLPLNEVTNYTNPIVYSVAPPLPVRRSTIDFNRALLLTATMYNANFPTAIFSLCHALNRYHGYILRSSNEQTYISCRHQGTRTEQGGRVLTWRARVEKNPGLRWSEPQTNKPSDTAQCHHVSRDKEFVFLTLLVSAMLYGRGRKVLTLWEGRERSSSDSGVRAGRPAEPILSSWPVLVLLALDKKRALQQRWRTERKECSR